MSDFLKYVQKNISNEAFIEKNITGTTPWIDWKVLEASAAGSFFAALSHTQQNPLYHGEGDVYTHTRMVCEELLQLPGFQKSSEKQRMILFLAALLHDIGKIRTTRQEDGVWKSPNHSAVGSLLARKFLWGECGLCGTKEKQMIRESVCGLIRHHMIPGHLFEQEKPERRLLQIASEGMLVTDFTLDSLLILAEADAKGRLAKDLPEMLEKIELCRMLAEENGCLQKPYPFASDFTRRAYLSGRNVLPDQDLYDDSWGEIILMSGLPGTGKDTWIREHFSEFPMVSLDEFRRSMHISPTDPQGPVIQAAHEQAKEYLRKKQPFVWNATDLTLDIRQKQISLFERYGASVRILYLETDWETQMERNRSREEAVPAPGIERMLSKIIPPLPWEAKAVEWHCV